MRGTRRCSVVDAGKRCPRLATKSVKEMDWICSKHWREFHNKVKMEHILGNTPDEAKASALKALNDDIPE